jgi:hypothetical protein
VFGLFAPELRTTLALSSLEVNVAFACSYVGSTLLVAPVSALLTSARTKHAALLLSALLGTCSW